MMKNAYLYLSLTIFLALLVVQSAFNYKENIDPKAVLAKAKTQYYAALEDFKVEGEGFEKEVQSEASWQDIQQAFKELRYSYKQIEFLAEYFDGQFIKDHVNGAPLPALERNAPTPVILEPEGLQVMDELVFAEEGEANREEVVKLAAGLNEMLDDMLSYHRRIPITHQHILEASRFQVIRIFTLGLTGFDTPMSGNAIPEAIVSLKAVQETLSLYDAYFQETDQELSQFIAEKLEGALQYLDENQDFDTFDRMAFYKAYVGPLYRSIGEMHLKTGIETYVETTPLYTKHRINYNASDLFDDDYLIESGYMGSAKQYYRDEVVALGKVLFFDPAMSKNNQRACASCHQPELAFSDGLEKSIATDFKGNVGRNAPGLINSVYATRYFYDLRAQKLEDQIEHVLVNAKEFHISYLQLFEKLGQSEEYNTLFKKAFPDKPGDVIDVDAISTAMSAYVASLNGLNSEFDQYARGEIDHIDQQVIDGFNLFMGKAACGTCHFAPIFNGLVPPKFDDSESEILGVTVSNDFENPVLDEDVGRMGGVAKEQMPIYNRSFKTTTVRNAALTAPYMHNGAYKTLEEVVTFYDLGGGTGMGLEVPYQTLPPDPLNLSDYEKSSLVVFMEALTDTTGVTGKPAALPRFPEGTVPNDRKIGGEY